MVYGSLTRENIRVNDNGYLCLNGLERSMGVVGEEPRLTIQGNPRYCPPEVITCQGYDLAIDSWKLGVVAYYLHRGEFPFKGRTIKELYHSILEETVSTDLPEFIQNLLIKDPQKRALPR